MIELIGHRGYPAVYPENTILGFKKAIDAGCDGIELDIRLTKDNKVVVIHDKDLDRTTNGKGSVGEYALKEMQKLDAGNGERIPTLEEVTGTFNDIKYLIEIKDDRAKSIRKLCEECLNIAGRLKNVIFISFSLDALLNIRDINPNANTGIIFSKEIYTFEKYKDIINAVCPRIDRLNKKVIEFAKKYSFEIYAWPVDNEKESKKAIQYGVTGIVSNDPGTIRKILKQ